MGKFTYEYYTSLLKLLLDRGYVPTSYGCKDVPDKCFILRHDVDYSLSKTLNIGEIDRELNISSVFFVQLSSGFYNVFSREGYSILDSLQSKGHEIGLHFDEQKYPNDFGVPDRIRERIIEESGILSHATGNPVRKVSMHRPSSEIINSDIKIPGMINTYGSEYIRVFKYVSDSRRRWREPFEKYIRNEEYNKFQILVHPFWYSEVDFSIEDSVMRFIRNATLERYNELDNNIRDLNDLLRREDI